MSESRTDLASMAVMSAIGDCRGCGEAGCACFIESQCCLYYFGYFGEVLEEHGGSFSGSSGQEYFQEYICHVPLFSLSCQDVKTIRKNFVVYYGDFI